MEKLALALITTWWKMWPYFQAHVVEVLRNFPLKQVFQKTDASKRLLKWAVELREFDITFKAKTRVKGQALADFVVEFTPLLEMEAEMKPADPQTWNLFVDSSSREIESGASIVLISPEGHKLNCVVSLGLKQQTMWLNMKPSCLALDWPKKCRLRGSTLVVTLNWWSSKLIVALSPKTRAWWHILSKSSNSCPFLKSSSWCRYHEVRTLMSMPFQSWLAVKISNCLLLYL